MHRNTDKPLVIIDGTASSGKSTAASLLAKHKGYQHINSGLMFRATGLIANQHMISPVVTAMNLKLADLDRPDLDTEFAGSLASKVAKEPDVRAAINIAIINMIDDGQSGTVMCGRAGFAEFPEAVMKIYITASDEECARRRALQLHKKNKPALFEDLVRKIRQRNHDDFTRAVCPMCSFEAAQSIYDDVIDNTEMQLEETHQRILRVAELRLPG